MDTFDEIGRWKAWGYVGIALGILTCVAIAALTASLLARLGDWMLGHG